MCRRSRNAAGVHVGGKVAPDPPTSSNSKTHMNYTHISFLALYECSPVQVLATGWPCSSRSESRVTLASYLPPRTPQQAAAELLAYFVFGSVTFPNVSVFFMSLIFYSSVATRLMALRGTLRDRPCVPHPCWNLRAYFQMWGHFVLSLHGDSSPF